MTKYTDLDALIVGAIASGTDTMMCLEHNETLKQSTRPFVLERKTIHFRILDGRLQALRKAGKIAFVGRKWHVLGAVK